MINALRRQNKRVAILGGLTVVAMLTFALRPTHSPNTAPRGVLINQYELVDTEIDATDRQGHFTLHLRSPLIHKPVASNALLLDEPHFELVSEQGSNWRGSAHSAIVNVHSDVVSFSNEVNLQQDARSGNPLTLLTSLLTVNLNTKNAVAPEKAQWTVGNGHLVTAGFNVDFNRHQIHLNSSIHGSFTH